jgi:uncharacterized RDD family membrane protein YckC
MTDPQHPEPAEPASTGTVADLGTRIVAKIVDFVALAAVYAIILVPIFFTALFGFGSVGFGFSGGAFVSTLISTAVFVGYFVVMEMSTGQTLGKMLLKLKVQNANGANPTFEEAVKRNAWMLVGIIPVLGGLIFLAVAIYLIITINNNTATREGWHDVFAGGTKVIKIG